MILEEVLSDADSKNEDEDLKDLQERMVFHCFLFYYFH